MMADASPPPGAVGILSGHGEADDRTRAAVRAAFGGVSADPHILVDGPLTLAWNPSAIRDLYVSQATVCYLDGRLYDLEDLRRTAAETGPPAQLLAAAFGRLGEDVLQLLRGDFWALLWNRERQRGFVACDQMGGRCPFWSPSGSDLVFGSDVPEVLAALPGKPPPDPVAMAHWLALTEAPKGRSLFAGVRRLEAGHLLELGVPGRDIAEPRRYWTPRYGRPLGGSRDELTQQLQAALQRSVQRRLADAAPASVLLSGGLDSSVVAALAARAQAANGGPEGRGLHAYSATFPGLPAVDESQWIDRTTAYLGLPSTRVVVRGGSALAGALPYMSTWQVPPTSPNLFFWTPLLERANADGIGVMLDGEGGDELFGFSPYLLADRIRQGRWLAASRLAARFPGSPTPGALSRRWRLLRRFGLKGVVPVSSHRITRSARGPGHYTPDWLRPESARLWGETDSSWAWKEIPGPRWWAWQVQAVTRGNGPALVYEQSRRRAAMAGLEARHPLVDVDVVELALRLPPELAFDPRHSRPMLRESVAGLLPDEVRLRPAKSSFDAVFHSALAGPDLPAVRRLLGAADAELGAYVDLETVQEQLLRPDPPADQWSRQRWAIQVWRLILAECWLRAQADGSFLGRLAERERLEGVDCDILTVEAARAPS